jgi:hypothetical protein
MSSVPGRSSETVQYELCFRALREGARTLSFPCDAEGHVRIDELSEHAREQYLYARALMGREYAAPCVLRVFAAA